MRFPDCDFRYDDTVNDARYCLHPMVNAPGCVVTPELCKMCQRRLQPAPDKLRSMDDIQHLGRRKLRCQHLGDQVGERLCESCRGQVRLKVYACHHPSHGQITLSECLNCLDFATASDT